MKAIVTGGAGFIGSHLTDRLLKEGFSVTVLDNFSNGNPRNLAHHQGNPKLELHQVDIADLAAIEPYFKGVDYLFHLAALADIVPSIQNPVGYYHSNVTGTMAVLECARKHQIKRIVYAASSSCYGIAKEYPTPETAPIAPEYPYALTKNLGEQMVMHWCKLYKLPAIALRFFNVYGPRARTSGTYGAVMGVFLAQKINGKPFTVVGDGEQTRDFTFVTDIADACYVAACSNVSGEIFNAGTGNPVSVNRLVELLGGTKDTIVHIPERPGEPRCTHADVSKIKRVLGWQSKVSFEEGIRIMLENIDYWKDAPVWTSDSIAQATQDWFRYLSPGKSK